MAEHLHVLERFGGRLWSAPAYLPYVQPPLTDGAVRAAEKQLQVQLPSTYLALLRQQNGGYLRGSHSVSRCLSGIGPRFPSITLDDAWWRPNRRSSQTWFPPGSEYLIPFDGEGHWDMCFDYRIAGSSGNPSVTFVSCDSEIDEAVAETFDAYLAALEDSLASEIRVYGRVTASELARGLAIKAGAAAPSMDAFNHGYEEWRVRMPAESEWIWCSPNLVPAGFHRQGSEVVVTAETAHQLAEDPDCVVLVSVTEASREWCIRALADLDLDARGADRT